ncbi:hypothetical protein H8E07_11755 [bacterium]|nr:hypothetical protein [bacterium]
MHCRVLSFGLVLAALVFLQPSAIYAVEPGWSTEFLPTGLNNRVLCSLETEDGLVVGGHFGAIGTESFARIALYDGESWRPLGEGFNSYVQNLVEYEGRIVAAGWFTASGGTPLPHFAQWDGEFWQPLGDGMANWRRGLVVYDGDLFCGGWRWDGVEWTEVLTADADIHASLVYEGKLIVRGGFSQVNGVPVTRLAAWDGEIVSAEYSEGLELPVYDLEVYQGQLVAYSEYHEPTILVRTGEDWVTLDGLVGGYYDNYNCMTVSDDKLYVMYNSGDGLHSAGYSCLYAWDGVEWSQELAVSSLGLYEFVSPYMDGVLVAGGFKAVEDVVAHYLAAYVDETVISFDGEGLGADAPVYDFAVGEQGLLVGGGFTAVAGIHSRGVVQHDGAHWVNRGFNNCCRGGDAAYASGWTSSSLVAQSYIYSDITEPKFVYWDETGWDVPYGGSYDGSEFIDFQIGDGWSYGVSTTTVTDVSMAFILQILATVDGGEISGVGEWNDDLLVYGSFTSVDGVAAAGLALYDGENWSDCCPALTGSVSALTTWDGRLVVAGNLSVDGGDPSQQILLWDGASPSILDGDFEGAVNAIAVYRGTLYVAGNFDTLEGTVVNNIARWGGLAWQPLGEGIESAGYWGLNDLAVHAGRLWVGGDFDYAGGHPAQNLCTWYEPPLPVFLQDMQAAREPGGVRVSWTVSGEGGEFLLARIDDGNPRVEVSRSSAAGSHHEVLDIDAPVGACRYVLYLCTSDGAETILSEAFAPSAVPSVLRLARPAPNPFNPATRIAFTLPRPGRATLTVHDVLGRRVATLLDESRSPGDHAVTWRGSDDHGYTVASGTYIVRLRAGEEHRTVKAVLLR